MASQPGAANAVVMSLRASAAPSVIECDAMPAVALLQRVDAGDMKCLRRFLLQLVMLDRGIVGSENLGHRIGEIHHAIRPRVVLDHGGLRTCFGHDQVARRNRRTRFGGDEQQMHRLFQHRVARQMQVSAIGHEGAIERAEYGLVLMVAQVRLQRFRGLLQGLRQTAQRRAGRQFSGCRQRGRMAAVMEYQQVRRAVVQSGSRIATHFAPLSRERERGWG